LSGGSEFVRLIWFGAGGVAAICVASNLWLRRAEPQSVNIFYSSKHYVSDDSTLYWPVRGSRAGTERRWRWRLKPSEHARASAVRPSV